MSLEDRIGKERDQRKWKIATRKAKGGDEELAFKMSFRPASITWHLSGPWSTESKSQAMHEKHFPMIKGNRSILVSGKVITIGRFVVLCLVVFKRV
jgi:hypothetical protein